MIAHLLQPEAAPALKQLRMMNDLAALALASAVGGCATVSSESPCDRAALAANARITENGVEVSRAGSVFSSARTVRWQRAFADASTGQTSAFAAYQDDVEPVLYAVRLKGLRRQIGEVEAMVNRESAHPFFAPRP